MDIAITPMEPGHYGVQVTEGHLTTSHRVTLHDGMLDDLNLSDVDPSEVVRASMEFLLDREKGPSIGDEVVLDDIPHQFPDYYDELRTRLAPLG